MQVSEVYIYFTFLDIKGDRSLLMLVETWQTLLRRCQFGVAEEVEWFQTNLQFA